MYPLVIIDMQPDFIKYQPDIDKLIAAVIEEIKIARSNNNPIIVLEYHGNGKTDARLRKHLDDYQRTFYLKKFGDSGASELLRFFEGKSWGVISLRVCGVNTTACVFKTVLDLHNAKMWVEVVSWACSSPTPHDKFLKTMEYLETVTVLWECHKLGCTV